MDTNHNTIQAKRALEDGRTPTDTAHAQVWATLALVDAVKAQSETIAEWLESLCTIVRDADDHQVAATTMIHESLERQTKILDDAIQYWNNR